MGVCYEESNRKQQVEGHLSRKAASDHERSDTHSKTYPDIDVFSNPKNQPQFHYSHDSKINSGISQASGAKRKKMWSGEVESP
ncbi:hypothetical protein E2C01_080889 [Portunus trituberculatus]|uniref:Uncharacterized protein n=1 Tax=Portunus trituberculatus TaxID=210409 RepID=A0A5B7IX93_PORTR|nr:hypothetical protein [Portunus trituberculatus]